MILDKVLALYETEPDLVKRRAPGRGNPTASSVGNCLAQLSMLRFPALTHPEPRPVRAAWVFEDGDLHAADLKAKVMRAFPGLTGLSEELFYSRIPLAEGEREQFERKIIDRDLWGTIRDGFFPPFVRAGKDGEKDRMRLVERDPKNPTRPRPMGFILDRPANALWAPLYVDHIVRHPEHGLVVLELKSASRFSFRKFLMGDFDYRLRMQLALIVEATGLPAVWMVKAKDTAHLLEVAFLPTVDKVRVEMVQTNGQREVYFVPKPGEVVDAEGKPVDADKVRESERWDVGEAWIPWDKSLLAEAGERVRRVLLFQPPPPGPDAHLGWPREYGPTFECATCGGTGQQTMSKGTGLPLVRGPKPCVDCGATGKMETATLPNFPCGYCSCTAFCWEQAKPVLELTDKPKWIVTRANYEASRITFTPHPERVESDNAEG